MFCSDCFLKQIIISIKYSLVLPRVCELSIAKLVTIWTQLYFGSVFKTFCFCGYSFLLDSIWWLGKNKNDEAENLEKCLNQAMEEI